MKKNQNSNNNESNLSSERSESSKETSIGYDELEKRVYFPDVANILEPKNKTLSSFVYLKDNTKDFWGNYPHLFDSDLKEFFKGTASEEKKYTDYKLLSSKVLLPSKNAFNFLA